MIAFLDNLLRQLFISKIDEITLPTQVRFEPPDQNWRTFVTGLSPNRALNVYLVDLRENRELRSNQRVRTYDLGAVNETQAPRRLDCHYLITAWSPAQAGPAVEPTIDEHLLLSKAATALTRNEPLIPRKIYAPAPLPAGFPDVIADVDLPSVMLPVDGFPKYAEFWGTMGTNFRWKPAIWLVVTVPILYDSSFAGPMVTTRIAEFRIGDDATSAEVWVQIGGQVSNPLGNAIANSPVRLTTLGNAPLQAADTDALGRFTFNRLRPGTYRLHAQAVGLGTKQRIIDVPSPTGEYDIQF